MKLFIAAILLILLLSPSVAFAEWQTLNGVSYEFTQMVNLYRFRGTFSTSSNPDCLLHIFYDFEHLPKILSDVDSFVLLRKGENRYDVAYVYNCLLLKGRIIYRRTLNQEQMKVSFEMLESDQRSSLLPKVVSSSGYYEIRIEKEGYRVIYFQDGRVAEALLGNIFSRSMEKESIKFIRGLKDYVERKCY